MSGNDTILASPEEVLSTMHSDGKRRWLYPVPSPGGLLRKRQVVGYTLIALFLGLPVVQIQGKPAMFLDLAHRQFTFFGKTFFATDTLLLMIFGITMALSAIMLTAILGRLWCGWACPQTVYLEFIFRPIERLIEGKPSVAKRRDEGGWTPDRIWRKGLKWSIFLMIALLLSHTFVAYFVSWHNLLEWMTVAPTKHWGFFLMMGVTTALVFFDFTYFREQMCTIACPYARMQSVLLDKNSLIVSYDMGRGEPRGRRKKGAPAKASSPQTLQGPIQLGADGSLHVQEAAQGDCIDCGACVRTCPTGIDIRDGLQMECIGCTQCIDACDEIMDKIKQPRGLIRYTSENALAGQPAKILRPRVLIYAALITVFMGAFGVVLHRTTGFDVDILRATGAPFVELPTGDITNRVKVRIQNRTGQTRDVHVEVLEPQGASLRWIGKNHVALEAGQLERLEAFIIVPRQAFVQGSAKARFKIGDGSEFAQEVDFGLLGPSASSAR